MHVAQGPLVPRETLGELNDVEDYRDQSGRV